MNSGDTPHGEETDYEGFTSDDVWNGQTINGRTQPSRYPPTKHAKKAMRSLRLPDAEDIAKTINKWKGNYPRTFRTEIETYKSKKLEVLLAAADPTTDKEQSLVNATADVEAEWRALEVRAEAVRQEKLAKGQEQRHLRQQQSAAQEHIDKGIDMPAHMRLAPAKATEQQFAEGSGRGQAKSYAALESPAKESDDEPLMFDWRRRQSDAKKQASKQGYLTAAPREKQQKLILRTGKAKISAPVAAPGSGRGLETVKLSRNIPTTVVDMTAASTALAGLPMINVQAPSSSAFDAPVSPTHFGGGFPTKEVWNHAPFANATQLGWTHAPFANPTSTLGQWPPVSTSMNTPKPDPALISVIKSSPAFGEGMHSSPLINSSMHSAAAWIPRGVRPGDEPRARIQPSLPGQVEVSSHPPYNSAPQADQSPSIAQIPTSVGTSSATKAAAVKRVTTATKAATTKRASTVTKGSGFKTVAPFSRTAHMDLESEMAILILALENTKKPEARASMLRQIETCGLKLREKNKTAAMGTFRSPSMSGSGRGALPSMRDRDRRSASPPARVQQGYRSRSPLRLHNPIHTSGPNTTADIDENEDADNVARAPISPYVVKWTGQ